MKLRPARVLVVRMQRRSAALEPSGCDCVAEGQRTRSYIGFLFTCLMGIILTLEFFFFFTHR